MPRAWSASKRVAICADWSLLDARALQVQGILQILVQLDRIARYLTKPNAAFRSEELTPLAVEVAGADWLALFNDQGKVGRRPVELPRADGSRPATSDTQRQAAAYAAYFKAHPRTHGCGATCWRGAPRRSPASAPY